MKVVQCVPNFSDGCNLETVEKSFRYTQSTWFQIIKRGTGCQLQSYGCNCLAIRKQ